HQHESREHLLPHTRPDEDPPPRRASHEDQAGENQPLEEAPTGVIADELTNLREAGDGGFIDAGGKLPQTLPVRLETPDRRRGAFEYPHPGSLPMPVDPGQSTLAPRLLVGLPVL